MSLRWLGVLVAGAGLFACAGPDDPVLDPQPSGESTEAIQGGYADPGDTAVVGIIDINNGAICSGSLLAPNMVLTARHCVSNTYNTAPNGGIICSQSTSGNPANATNLYVTPDQSMEYQGNWYQGVEVVVIPGDNLFCGHDQAIIILEENIPPEVAVPLVPRVDTALIEDELYYAVGYGQTSDSPNAPSGSRRRRDDLHAYCVEDGCSGSFSAYVKPSEWIGDTGICSGDSGGPAIDLLNRVVGVTSRGGANCSSPIYGSVHSWGQWIKDTAIHAAALGGYEPASWTSGWPTDPSYSLPIGDPCDSACAYCINEVCTRPCLPDTAPCPESYECTAFEDGTQFCTPIPEPTSDDDDDGGGKKKKGDSADEEAESDGCSAGGREDPTNPVPWRTGALALAVLALRRRRRR